MTSALLERLVAVVGDVDRVALAAQAPGHGVGEIGFVVDDQQAHRAKRYSNDGPTVPRAGGSAAPAGHGSILGPAQAPISAPGAGGAPSAP